ncbi:RPM1-interacting protein 4-like isoform X3 [Impatiens glandulifera]|uniref:RPM1-interacting protein 4-like isoform X3 n=1 Tax=Impatiens glandulifera TaxID=253017 RepID=UPI001FB062F0|nr:RPM1-interacting protein 4-like isoform X3 [Impatiens glandulifera]
MAQKQGGGRGAARVPKFGEWGNQKEQQQNPVPYTMYFDNARKDKSAGGGAIKIINPNDPQENPQLFAPQLQKPTTAYNQERLPLPPNTPPRPVIGSNRRNTSTSAGSDYSLDRSPLHQANRATPGRDQHNNINNTNTSRNRRPGSRDDLSHHQTQERGGGGTVIPKFGAWNEQDPTSSEDLTQIFERSRKEKNYPSSPSPAAYNNMGTPSRQQANKRNNDHNQDKMCGCFPW